MGKVNALSGETWDESMKQHHVQDYVVCPLQPWLDGINSGDGYIKQFIAMPLGSGYTVEHQVTGEDKHGGAQVICYAPHEDKRVKQATRHRINNAVHTLKSEPISSSSHTYVDDDSCPRDMNDADELYYAPFHTHQHHQQSQALYSLTQTNSQTVMEDFAHLSQQDEKLDILLGQIKTIGGIANSISDELEKQAHLLETKQKESRHTPHTEAKELGLAAGGKMSQQIVEDPYGFSFWDESTKARVFIHIVNSAMFYQITGDVVPPSPITAQTYSSYKYPWYDFYDETVGSVPKSNILSQVKSVKEVDQEKHLPPQQDDSTVQINNVKTLTNKGVRDGNW